MSNAAMFISFNLVKGASVQDFLNVSKRLNDEFMSKQKGYISWKQLVDGEMWADFITWETMDDARNAMEPSCENALANEFYSFLDPESIQTHLFTVERSY